MLSRVKIFITEVLKNKDLLFRLILNDIKTKYLGSIGGLIWNFINPILLVTIYIFVFTYIFQIKVSAIDGMSGISAFYIISGVAPWFIVIESLGKSTVILIENGNIIKKTYFSLEVLPAQAVLTPFVNFGLIVFILGVTLSLYRGDFIGLAMLPMALFLLMIILFGMSMIICILCLVARDILPIVQIILNISIYLTPILYTRTMLPEIIQKIMFLNPFYPVISIFQRSISGINTVDTKIVILAFFWSLFFFLIGVNLFEKTKEEIVDWL